MTPDFTAEVVAFLEWARSRLEHVPLRDRIAVVAEIRPAALNGGPASPLAAMDLHRWLAIHDPQ